MRQPLELIQPGKMPGQQFAAAQAEQDMLSTAKGGSVLIAGRLINYVSRFAIVFIMARLLGAEKYGLYNLAISAATIVGAVSVFGLDTTLTRFIAIMNGRQDKQGLWGVIQVGLGTSLLFSLLASTGLFALAYPVATQIFHEPRLVPLLQVASLIVPFLTMSDVLAGATRGFKRMSDTVYAQNIVQPLVRLVLIVVLALTGMSLPVAILIYGAADMSASILLLYFLNKRVSLRQPLATGKRNPQKMMAFTLPLWLSDLLTIFGGNLRILLIGSLGSVSGAGVFSVANQVSLIGNILHSSMSQSAKPLIAELSDQGKHTQIEHIYQTTTRWVVTLNMPIVLINTLFPVAIMSMFGKSFEEGAAALAIMGLVNLVDVSTGMCAAILDMTGHTRLKLLNSVIRVSLAILASLLLIPRYGITGAAMAALIHEVVANSLPLFQLWFLYRILPYNREFLKPVLSSVLAALTALVLRQWLPETGNLLLVAVQVMVVLAVYALTIQILGLSSEERLLVKRVHHRITLLFSRH